MNAPLAPYDYDRAFARMIRGFLIGYGIGTVLAVSVIMGLSWLVWGLTR